jgi:NarL family two-component system response regulator LiaR
MSIQILLVDDHQMMRDGLRSTLDLEDDLDVVGEAANGCRHGSPRRGTT